MCTVRDYWPLCYWGDRAGAIRRPAILCPGCSAAAMTRCLPPAHGAAWPLTLPVIPYMRANLRRKQADLADADVIVAVSSSRGIVRFASARPRLPPARIEVIPNGVDVARTSRARRGCDARPMDPNHTPCSSESWRSNKGVHALVEVVERARLEMPLVVIGDGPERAG